MKSPFTIAADACSNSHVAERIRIEGRIVRKLVETAIELGHFVSLNDGEEWVVRNSDSVTKIVNAAFSTDEDVIRIGDRDGERLACFHLVYGNDGYDVISDHSSNAVADEIMSVVTPYIDHIEENA